jgi:hypothetical protein
MTIAKSARGMVTVDNPGNNKQPARNAILALARGQNHLPGK